MQYGRGNARYQLRKPCQALENRARRTGAAGIAEIRPGCTAQPDQAQDTATECLVARGHPVKPIEVVRGGLLEKRGCLVKLVPQIGLDALSGRYRAHPDQFST